MSALDVDSPIAVVRKMRRRCRKLSQQQRGNGTAAISCMNATFPEQPLLRLEPPLSKIAPPPPRRYYMIFTEFDHFPSFFLGIYHKICENGRNT